MLEKPLYIRNHYMGRSGLYKIQKMLDRGWDTCQTIAIFFWYAAKAIGLECAIPYLIIIRQCIQNTSLDNSIFYLGYYDWPNASWLIDFFNCDASTS